MPLSKLSLNIKTWIDYAFMTDFQCCSPTLKVIIVYKLHNFKPNLQC